MSESSEVELSKLVPGNISYEIDKEPEPVIDWEVGVSSLFVADYLDFASRRVHTKCHLLDTSKPFSCRVFNNLALTVLDCNLPEK